MNTKNQATVKTGHLITMASKQGFHHRLSCNNTDEKVMQGHFFYDNLSSGISLHGSDVIEEKNLLSSSELPASLSFNILLKGEITFFMENTEYKISSQENSQATCVVGILARRDLLTRKITHGQTVKKVNVFVERTWLESRCHDEKSKALLANIFSHHARLYQWLDHDFFSKIALQLLGLDKQKSLQNELIKEQLAYALLSKVLQLLPSKLPHPYLGRTIRNKTQKKLDKTRNIANHLANELLNNDYTLVEIASHFGVSISTLQRNFKQSFNMTVTEYIRVKRLERAKTEITLNKLSIGEAAYQAKYNHVSNFIAAFKKQFNITPAHIFKVHHLQ